MIAVDTNVLARFYIEDPDDQEAVRQYPKAKQSLLNSGAVFVPKTVVLELEWVMRGFYKLQPEAFCQVLEHLLGMAHVIMEDWEAIKDACDTHRQGLDFADALHLASSKDCRQFHSFDDRRFGRRAAKLGLLPEVVIP